MKREATADAAGAGDRERASATPARGEEAERPRYATEPAVLPERLSLREHQRWLLSVVTTPESDPAPIDEASAARLVTPSARLGAPERLDIYRRGYHARLIECLADDYPALAHALGDEAFERLCRAYIAAYPSSHPSLNFFGQSMSELCRAQPLPHGRFAADLAALEWAVVLAIHAPTAPALDVDALAGVPPDGWPRVRLAPNPSLRILALERRAHTFFQAFRAGEPIAVPRDTQATSVAVYRTDRTVWRMELERPMLALVESLAAGAPLARALEQAAPLLDASSEAERARAIQGWFRDAVSSGLFSAVVA